MDASNSPTPLVNLTPKQTTSLREEMRRRSLESVYYLAKAVLGFKEFTSGLHLPLCDWVQAKPLRKVLLVPRGHFKSSLGSIAFPIWLLCNNPDTRILLANATATNASHFLRRIKSVFERNEIFRWLFPEIVPDFKRVAKWSETEIQLPRPGDFPEASIETIGVGGKVTSRHYDWMIKDDLIEETAANSIDELAKIESWNDYSESLFDQPEFGHELVIGTRWHLEDMYGKLLQDTRYVNVVKKALNPNEATGQVEALFPERFSIEYLMDLRQRKPKMFATQYMNDPVDSSVTEFSSEFLIPFQIHEGQARWDGGRIGVASLNRYMHLDPSISEKRGACKSAIMVTGVWPTGQVGLLDEWIKVASLTAVLDKLYELWKRWRPQLLTVETVAAQKWLLHIIRTENQKRGLNIRVEEFKPGGLPKDQRIRTLDNWIERGFFYRRNQLGFLQQYERFPAGLTEGMESYDGLDSLAQGPSVWRIPFVDQPVQDEDDVQLVELVSGRSKVTGY